MMILLSILLSPISSVCGRAGGMSTDPTAKPTWIPMWMRQSWVRDWVCPLFCLVLVLPHSWFQLAMWLCAYGAMGGMLTTYWDWINGKDNFWIAGFCVGMALIFLIPLGVSPYLIATRAIVVAIFWGLLNLYCNNKKVQDGTEELVRYGFLCLTTGVMLI